ncbi:MAG: N-acetyl-gamma-glutamyl-phosphate reductase [Saprospiraceae bacterium]|nr:N-acetyl-gamma-glutamyl-phosphate reductase [Saprospiraceae bacterium]
MTNIRIGIIGGAGYTGGELLRIVLQHPGIETVFVHSKSNGGQPVASVHRDLSGGTDLRFSADYQTDVDVWFLCVGHGEAQQLLKSIELPAALRIIDLSQDFRLAAQAQPGDRQFVYGLPELNRTAIQSARNIANPGCFATAIQLSLLPLAAAGILQTVHVTGITGATGAGQSLQASQHFAWRANNISAYKTLCHQHLGEINQSLGQLLGQQPAPVHFIPWRGDFTRGIFSSACTFFEGSLEEAQHLFEDFYRDHPFTHLSREPIDLKQVVNTNKCLLFLEIQDNQLVIHAAIDNLLKGASGQAVQNMNLMFGLEETSGLRLKATYF